jgi:hypothetical protein
MEHELRTNIELFNKLKEDVLNNDANIEKAKTLKSGKKSNKVNEDLAEETKVEEQGKA